MGLVEAIFIAYGESHSVLDLAEHLAGELQLRQCIGEVAPGSSTPAAVNSLVIKLPLTDDSRAMDEVANWLEHHRSAIGSVEGRKIIEFQTILDAHTPSVILTIPHSLVVVCGQLGLDLANQAFRVLSETDLNSDESNSK